MRMRRVHPPGKGRRLAFTLVELLVVIAIIALLISILLPSLAKAKEQAKKLKCLANLKDLTSAMNGYASSDPGENLIPVHPRGVTEEAPPIPGPDGSGGWRTFVGQNEWGGRGGNPEMIENPTPSEAALQFTQFFNFGPGDRPLNKYLYSSVSNAGGSTGSADLELINADAQIDLPQFHCPSDSGWAFNEAGASLDELASAFGWDPRAAHYDLMGNSYRTHAIWTNQTARNEEFTSSDNVLTASPYMRPSSQVPNPSRVILITEGNAYYTETWNREEFDSPTLFGGYVSKDHWATGWHGGFQTFNAAFVDGHAGVIEENIRSNVAVSMPSASLEQATEFTYGEWLQVGSRPEWIQTPTLNAAMYASVMARGDGWQLDCLPAPNVITMSP